MPEGDTVYRTARRLREALDGAVLTRCEFRVPAFATLDLSGSAVSSVGSYGKHLFIRAGELSIHSHLGMDGEWRVYAPGAPWRKPAFLARIVLGTADCTAVGFELKTAEVLSAQQEQHLLDRLGPDLLGDDWDPAEAARRLAADPDRPVAVALLDQRNLAGLGNEYVNELCFLRGMLPDRPASRMDASATVALAHRLIVANRDRPVRTTTGNTRRGEETWVYRRAGEPCRRCGTRIRRGELGARPGEERITFFCPHCQS